MIEFTCPSCAANYRVPAEHAGKKTACRKCKKALTVPTPAAARPPAPSVPPAAAPASAGWNPLAEVLHIPRASFAQCFRVLRYGFAQTSRAGLQRKLVEAQRQLGDALLRRNAGDEQLRQEIAQSQGGQRDRLLEQLGETALNGEAPKEALPEWHAAREAQTQLEAIRHPWAQIKPPTRGDALRVLAGAASVAAGFLFLVVATVAVGYFLLNRSPSTPRPVDGPIASRNPPDPIGGEPVTPPAGTLPATWSVMAKAKPTLAIDAEGHTAAVRKVLLADKGRQAITVSLDKTVRLWDVETGDLLKTLRLPSGPGDRGQLEAAALSTDEKFLAVAGRAPDDGPAPIYLISPDSGELLRVIRGHLSLVRALSFSPDGKRIAVGGEDKVARVYNVHTGASETTFTNNTETYSLAFSPEGDRLLIGGHDEVKIWPARGGAFIAWWSPSVRVYNPDDPTDVNQLRERFVFNRPITASTWHPDGKSIAVGTEDGIVRIYDAMTKKPPLRLIHLSQSPIQAATQPVRGLAFTPDGKALFHAGCNVLGKPASGIIDLTTGKRRAEAPHEGQVLDGAISRDGKLAISTGGPANETFVWNTTDGSEVAMFAGRGLTVTGFLAWSPDGQTLAWRQTRGAPTGYPYDRALRLSDIQLAEMPTEATIPYLGRRMPQPEKYRIRAVQNRIERVPNVAGGKPDAQTEVDRKDEDLRGVVYTSDNHAAVAGRFGIYIVDIDKVKIVRRLTAHSAPVLAMTPTADGRRLASASADQTIRIWDPNQEQPLLSLFLTDSEWVAWTTEGYYAASAGGERLMGWQISPGPDALATYHPAAQFRKSLYRPDLLEKVFETGNLAQAVADAAKENRAPAAGNVEQARPPLTAITYPPGPAGHRVAGTQLTVRAAARSVGDQPVVAMRLLVDGRPYGGAQGVRKIASPKLGDVEVSWPVELQPGRHVLAVQAESAVSKGLSPILEVTNTAGNAAPPNLYVVAAGINDYAPPLTLNFAAPDADAITAALRETDNAKIFNKVEVKLLKDRQASRAEIEKALEWLKSKMTPKDIGVFYFSGHGDRDDSGNFYLIPVDVNPRNIAGSCISGTYLKQTLGDVSGRVVAILDACHSGAAIEARKRPQAADDLVRDLVSDDYGIVVLSSSLGKEFSLESPAVKHGFYTQALIEGMSGLADRNRNGVVDLNELERYTIRRVEELSQGQQHPVANRPPSIRAFPLAVSAKLPPLVVPPLPPEVVLPPLGEKTELQGLWQWTKHDYNGMPRESRDHYWAIHRNKIRHDMPTSMRSYQGFKIDPTTTPKQITIFNTAIDGREETWPGIYTLEGDVLKVASNPVTDERPTQLASPKDGKILYLEFKRVSPNPDAPKPTRETPTTGAKQVASIRTDHHTSYLAYVNDHTLHAGGSGGAGLYDLNTKKLLRETAKERGLRSMSVTADGKTMFFGTSKLTAIVMEVETGKEIATYRAPQLLSTAFAPDGKQVALGNDVLRIVDVASGKEQELFKQPGFFATAADYSPDGKLLAAALGARLILFDPKTGAEVRNWDLKQGNIKSIRFSPDGKTLVSGGWTDRTVKLWNVETGAEIRSFPGHEENVQTLAFSRDGKRLASGSAPYGPGRGEIKVWETETAKPVASIWSKYATVTAVIFSPDGRHIAAGQGSELVVWEIEAK